MKRFTDAIRSALDSQNWYGALIIALTLPDVCGGLETPGSKSGERTVRWFKQWMEPDYAKIFPFDSNAIDKAIKSGAPQETIKKLILPNSPGIFERIFLSGADFYALRCALLHEGTDNIETQKAKEAIDRFIFTVPAGGIVHCNLQDQHGKERLQLDVSIFCKHVADRVDAWDMSVTKDIDIQERKKDLITIA